jgi:hypothetical protein
VHLFARHAGPNPGARKGMAGQPNANPSVVVVVYKSRSTPLPRSCARRFCSLQHSTISPSLLQSKSGLQELSTLTAHGVTEVAFR